MEKTVKAFKKFYEQPIFIEQIDLFRYEDMHTNFLANLLKEDNIYELKNEPLLLFLSLCGYDFNNITNIRIVVRKKLGGTNSKPDILITFKVNNKDYVLVIENKVSHVEGIVKVDGKNYSQCEWYKILIEQQYSNYEKIYVYLTLKFEIIKDYITITYSTLLNDFLEKLQINKNLDNKNILDEYVFSYKQFYTFSDSYENIPISTEGKQLTIDLKNKLSYKNMEILGNKQTEKIYLINMCNILKDDENELSEYSELLKNKKYYKCEYNGEKIFMNKLILKMIKYIILKDGSIDNMFYLNSPLISDCEKNAFYDLITDIEGLDGMYYLASWYFHELKDFLNNYLDEKYRKYFNIKTSADGLMIEEV